ncbi:MAG: hypothetical protein RLZZ224_625, partial [Verrucomicrobiota bacterium]
KLLLGPDAAGSPIIAAARFLAVDELERAIFHHRIFTPSTAKNVLAGGIL